MPLELLLRKMCLAQLRISELNSAALFSVMFKISTL